MSETSVQVIPPADAAVKEEKAISVVQAEKDIEKSGFRKKLDPKKIKFRARVGKYIEQEGAHHLTRAMLLSQYEELEGKQATCEEILADLKGKEQSDEYVLWMKVSITVIEQMNKCSQQLALARNTVEPEDNAAASKVRTMPARTVITNNTQINVNPKPPEPIGHTT